MKNMEKSVSFARSTNAEPRKTFISYEKSEKTIKNRLFPKKRRQQTNKNRLILLIGIE